MRDTFDIYYKNEIKNSEFYATNVILGYDISDIIHPFLMRIVKFSTNETRIDFVWDEIVQLNSLVLIESNATELELILRHNDDPSSSDERGAWIPLEKGGIRIVSLDDGKYKSATLFLSTDEPELEISNVFIGTVLHLSRFVVQPSLNLEINGKGSFTPNGNVYGLQWQSLRTLSVAFSRIGLNEYNKMNEFIDAVQYTIPHIIVPYDYDEQKIKPLYAALTKAGDFKQRDENGFWFDTAMDWKESR